MIEFLIEKIRREGEVDAFDCRKENGPEFAEAVAQSLERKGLQMIAYGRAWVNIVFEGKGKGLIVKIPVGDFCEKTGLPRKEIREQLDCLF
ncbi:hypothetical protein KKF38_05510 [Patescibacteria group bacterium]|nr:hypothetical protein [Patescibacteria group bacterium]